MWRVRDGHCIKAYSDNWIPNLISGRSSLCELSGTVLVKYLISPSRTWKENEVRELFPSLKLILFSIFH